MILPAFFWVFLMAVNRYGQSLSRGQVTIADRTFHDKLRDYNCEDIGLPMEDFFQWQKKSMEPLVPDPPVQVLCFRERPVFHAAPQVTPEQFKRDIPVPAGHGGNTEFSFMPCEKFVEFLCESCFERIVPFPDPDRRVQVRAPAGAVHLIPDLPDMLAPLAAQGIEKRIDHLA
jgi:hypothetical protein